MTRDEIVQYSPSSSEPLHRIEFHRQGFVLVPDTTDPVPGVAFLLRGSKNQPDLRSCSCDLSRKQTCHHILALVDLYKRLCKLFGERPPQEVFRASIWSRLAGTMADGCQETIQSVRLQYLENRGKRLIQMVGSHGQEMLQYLSQGPDADRFLERFIAVEEEDTVPHRGALLQKLAMMTMSDNERLMLERGFKSLGMALEESPWHRLSYHCFRELGSEEPAFQPAIEEMSGTFTINCSRAEGDPLFRMVIPRARVPEVLRALKKRLLNQHGVNVHPTPLKSIFKVTMNTELDLEVRPLIQVIKENGESKFFDRQDLEKYRYGNLIYVKELGILAELEPPGKARKFLAPQRMVLKRSQVPSFLDEFGKELREGPHILDAGLKSLKILKEVARVEVSPEAIDRDWCWLSVRYGLGNSAISLSDLLDAKRKGQRFLPTSEGWVDCESSDFDGLDWVLGRRSDELAKRGDQLRLSLLDLFRLKAAGRHPLQVAGDGPSTSTLERILQLEPARPLSEPNLISPLRPYQKIGVEWLRFLFENGLGGILCDEMGLGKTHQVMGLMMALRDQSNVKGPFLIVSPTTVLSHWRNKIRDHAPQLNATVFHGGQRDLGDGLRNHDVLITSYGIIRNDIEKLMCTCFPLVVFDEIQNIKNSRTKAYEAANNLKAKVKIGLTGTPMENRLEELKALLDLTVPGYLGTDDHFNARYVRPIELERSTTKRRELNRLISPFTMRRLKETVLTDLPEKIEDIRTCELSDDQLRLYRDAISSRKGIIDVLERGEEAIPYMHIFALLNLLKQICDHPALVENRMDNYERYQSGKWELFKELLAEGLDSGQKIVIYSQYIGMIQIIEKHLQTLQEGYVTLTGRSRGRGEIVSRFNTDPECRVYVGSLKAGGTGIDLVAASVVIHYDRWWNAAKEDQATDRVHRIGQRRGVQVFKLLTEGTLEEKISAIIGRKKSLMEDIVREDDPSVVKSFTREDLMEMLSTAPSRSPTLSSACRDW